MIHLVGYGAAWRRLPDDDGFVAGNLRRTRGRRGQAPEHSGLETFGPSTRLGGMVFGGVRLVN
ncbi:hypothetical protein IG631_14643 [Alternaria alternata]|nr:hypothetical protein IG631_14643 [Alternaria alternata]